jgi:hypothetical protein
MSLTGKILSRIKKKGGFVFTPRRFPRSGHAPRSGDGSPVTEPDKKDDGSSVIALKDTHVSRFDEITPNVKTLTSEHI